MKSLFYLLLFGFSLSLCAQSSVVKNVNLPEPYGGFTGESTILNVEESEGNVVVDAVFSQNFIITKSGIGGSFKSSLGGLKNLTSQVKGQDGLKGLFFVRLSYDKDYKLTNKKEMVFFPFEFSAGDEVSAGDIYIDPSQIYGSDEILKTFDYPVAKEMISHAGGPKKYFNNSLDLSGGYRKIDGFKKEVYEYKDGIYSSAGADEIEWDTYGEGADKKNFWVSESFFPNEKNGELIAINRFRSKEDSKMIEKKGEFVVYDKEGQVSKRQEIINDDGAWKAVSTQVFNDNMDGQNVPKVIAINYAPRTGKKNGNPDNKGKIKVGLFNPSQSPMVNEYKVETGDLANLDTLIILDADNVFTTYKSGTNFHMIWIEGDNIKNEYITEKGTIEDYDFGLVSVKRAGDDIYANFASKTTGKENKIYTFNLSKNGLKNPILSNAGGKSTFAKRDLDIISVGGKTFGIMKGLIVDDKGSKVRAFYQELNGSTLSTLDDAIQKVWSESRMDYTPKIKELNGAYYFLGSILEKKAKSPKLTLRIL